MEHVCRRGSADALDDELKYLSDLDAARLHASYGLFRVIVWAIPILGFLGTVIGITMMLGGASNMANGGDQASMLEIFQGLGLEVRHHGPGLDVLDGVDVRPFLASSGRRPRLLEQVDRACKSELAGRFAACPPAPTASWLPPADGRNDGASDRDRSCRRQAELWQAAVEAAARQWAEMAEAAGGQVKARDVGGGRRAWPDRPRCSSGPSRPPARSCGSKTALNHNLAALAGAKHFEQTVLSLAAAVNMLSARLAESPTPAVPIRLEGLRRSAHAA